MSDRVYRWNADDTGDVHTAPASDDGLLCLVIVSPGAFVKWEVRVGDASGLCIGYGAFELKPATVEHIPAAVPFNIDRAKRAAQEHADDIASWHRDRLAAETARLREELEAVTRGKIWELHPLNMYEGSMRERACGDGRVSSREVLYALGYSAESRKERDAALAREAALVAAAKDVVAAQDLGLNPRDSIEDLREALAAHKKAKVPSE